jgi:ribosomal protein L7/L12
MTQAAFLIVKRFRALYRSYERRTPLGIQLYSIPQEGVEPDSVPKRYRGLDRDPVDGLPLDSMARILRADPAVIPVSLRAPALAMASLTGASGTPDFLLPCLDEACNVYLTLGEPEDCEIIWARLGGSGIQPPPQTVSLGFEPTGFPEGHFSALCDCMCFPRWHGTDDEGTLFADHHARLNSHGLFDSSRDAADFLSFYTSLDWTETGESSIVEVHALSDAFYEQLRSPVRYVVQGGSMGQEPVPYLLEGMTWRIRIGSLARDRKIRGILALREFTGMGLAETKAVVEGLPMSVIVVHIGDPELLRNKLIEAGFDFEMAAHG